jgi:predicted cupin superfamily sugar epimerase
VRATWRAVAAAVSCTIEPGFAFDKGTMVRCHLCAAVHAVVAALIVVGVAVALIVAASPSLSLLP